MDSKQNREIEVKFLLDSGITFSDIHDVLDGYHHDLWQEYHMVADYLDTEDGDLNNLGVAYRIRQENDKIVATLKAGSVDEQGLAQRYEVNEDVASLEPSLEVFAKDEKYGEKIKSLLGKKLVSKLKMDFIRQASVFQYGSAKIEVAVDRGVIIKGEKQAGIWELELELKEGPVEDLLRFKQAVMDFFQLTVAKESKYARGLAL